MSSDKFGLRRDLGRLLRLMAVVTPIIMLLYLFKAPPIYQAVARIQIDREQDNLIKLDALLATKGPEESTYLETQYKNLLSRTLIKSVIQDLRLDHDERYAKRWDIVRAVADDISITPVPMSRLVDIKVEVSDPRVATNIANTLARHFIERNVDLKTEAALKNVDKLRDEATREAQKYQMAEKALAEYQNARAFLPLNKDQSPAAEELTKARAAFAMAQSRTRKARDHVAAIEQHTAGGKSLATSPLISSDPLLGQVEIQMVLLESDLAGLRKAHGEEALEVQQARAKLDATRAAMDRMAQARFEMLKSEVNLADLDERAQAANVTEWEGRASEWMTSKIGYDVLQVNAESAKALYRDVLAKMKETELNSRNKINNITLVDLADVPLKPGSPHIGRTLIFALFLAYGFLMAGRWLRHGSSGSSGGTTLLVGAPAPAH